MKSFLGLKNAKRNWKVTFFWLVVCCVSLAAAFIVGVSGNRAGLLLCYAATIALVLAFVHTWRDVWKFLILLGASAVGFFVFVLLHNVFYGLGRMVSEVVILHHLLEFLHAVCFLVAIMLCPAGFLVGAVGGAAASFKAALTSTKMNRKMAFVFLAVCCTALIVALLVFIGIPPTFD